MRQMDAASLALNPESTPPALSARMSAPLVVIWKRTVHEILSTPCDSGGCLVPGLPGRSANTAYDVADATVRIHEAWWLWPNTCLMRYPGRGNAMMLHVIPAGPHLTRETWDFYLADPEPNETEAEAIRYIDEVLQPEDIGLTESVQRGMRTPAFTSGRLIHDPEGSGVSEHGVHHFQSLLLEAYRAGLAGGG